MKATASYKPTTWDEKPYEVMSPASRLTRVSAVFAFSGQLDGVASVEYLMFYRHFDANDQHASAADYVGLLRFQGSLNGKTGSFVMEDRGVFQAGAANSILRIVPRSGGGDLAGISGAGCYSATASGCSCELDYQLD